MSRIESPDARYRADWSLGSRRDALRWICGGAALAAIRLPARGDEILPKHLTQPVLKCIRSGLEFLARTQDPGGSWPTGGGGQAYPVAMTALAGMALLANGNTPTRGRYAPQVKGAAEYLAGCSTSSGLITGANQEMGRPMHGHGFALMYLACTFGSVIHEGLRKRMQAAIDAGIHLTSRGQSAYGGWTYVPGTGDEGSVTVTQVQGLRAAQNAGFSVPRSTIEQAVRYLERCSTPEGGICYSLASGGGPRLPISAAAVATLYNAGEYESPLADRCLQYVWQHMGKNKSFSTNAGHDFYAHLYAAQAFYQAGDKYWDEYFPRVRDELLKMQKEDGSWEGDGIGATYGTAIALIVLQLPYKFVPIFQR